MPLTFIEACSDGGPAPSTSTITIRTASDGAIYQLKNSPTPGDLQAAITTLLGDVKLDVNAGATAGTDGVGALRRTLPVPHPVFQYHYCSAIPSIQGIGVPVLTQSPDALFTGLPPQSTYAAYPEYDFKLQFNPVTYAVLPDESISNFTGHWYDESGSNLSIPFSYVNEWLRFSDFLIQPAGDFITATIGNGMKFRTTQPPGPTSADGKTFTGQAKYYLPNSILKFTWYQVPYRYVLSANSYLEKYRGYINQNDWYNWKAGQLLYLNYAATRFTPPVPTAISWTGATDVFPTSGVSQAKLCDLELTFLLTRRNCTDAPVPANKNSIPAHNNVQKFLGDRLWHYISTVQNPDTDNTKGAAFFPSFPVEILFMDPDAVLSNSGL
jgi:hypothetical protein